MGDVAEERQLAVTIKKERTYENNKVTNVRVIVTPTVEGEDFENDFICNSEEWIKLNDGLGSVYKDFTSNITNYEISLQYVSEEIFAYWYQYDGTIDITEMGLELYEPIGWEKPKKIKDGYVTLEDGQELPVIPAKYEGKTPVNVTNLEKMDNAIAYLFEHGVFNGGSSLQEETNSLRIKELESEVDNQRIDIENIELKNTEQDDLITQLENKNIELQNKNNEQDELITELQTEVNELKDNALTNEVEGTNIYVDDSASARVLELGIDGNSYQVVRSGKNLLNPEIASKQNGTITWIGSGSKYYFSCASLWGQLYWNFDVKKGEKYTFTLKEVPTSIKIFLEKFVDGKLISRYVNNGSENAYTITIDEDSVLRVLLSNNESVENAVIEEMMLEQGDTATEYEQYGASPSPDYPSNIEVVKGYNLLDTSNFENGYYDATGLFVENTANALFDYIPVKESTYILTANQTMRNLNIQCFDEEKNWIKRVVFTNTNKNTLTITSDIAYVRVNANYNNVQIMTSDLIKTLDLQLVESDVEKPYVPYKNIGIKTTGKNLFKNELVTITNSTNWTLENITNGIKVTHNNSYATGSPSVTYNLKPNTTYTLSSILGKYTGTNAYISINYRDTWKYNFDLLTTNSKTFTTDETGILKLGFGGVSASSYVEFTNIQLEEGTVATSYEPYQENINYIDLQDNEICKVGDIKDELDLTTGILTKRIGKVVLNGSEEIYCPEGQTFEKVTRYYFYNIIKSISASQCYSNYFLYKENQKSNTPFNAIDEEAIHIRDNGTEIGIKIDKTIATTVEEFKTWLSENPVTVYYQLRVPFEVNLGEIKMPKTINHVTNINLLATLESNMKLKYVRSTNVVIDNLAKAIVALGGEL